MFINLDDMVQERNLKHPYAWVHLFLLAYYQDSQRVSIKLEML